MTNSQLGKPAPRPSHVDENILSLHQLLDNYRAPYSDYSLMIARHLLPLDIAIYHHEDSWIVLTTLLARACQLYHKDPDSRLEEGARFILNHWITNDRHQRIIANQTYVWSSAAITYPQLLTKITGTITDHYLNLFLALSHYPEELAPGFRDTVTTLLDTWNQYYSVTPSDYQNIRYLYHEMSQSMDRTPDIIRVEQYLDSHRHEPPPWIIPAPAIAPASNNENATTDYHLPDDPISDLISYLRLKPTKHDYRVMMQTYQLAPLAQRLVMLYPLYGDSVSRDPECTELVELPPNPYGVTAEHLAYDREQFRRLGPSNGSSRMLDEDYLPDSCQICGNHLPPRYGLRFPLARGGWAGWYCSFACLEEEMVITQSVELSTDVLSRLTTFKRALFQYGIYDRI